MAATNKPSTRIPGRTPPFILIGVLLLLAILGYNYWSLWNANADLLTQLDVVRIQKKDGDQLIVESEKKLANSRGNLIEAHENLNQARKQIQNKESELASVKTEVNNKQSEIDKFRNEKGQCDSSLVQVKGELDALKGQKDELQKQLDELKAKPTTCDAPACKDPIRDVITAVGKIATSDDVRKVLSEAKLDANSLMEGIQFLVQTQKSQNEEQKTSKENAQAQKGNQDESKNDERKNEVVETMNVEDNRKLQLDRTKNVGGNVLFYSDKNKNEIPKQLANLEKEEKTEAEDSLMDKEINVRNVTTTEPVNMLTTDNEIVTDKEGTADQKKDEADEQNERIKMV